MSAPHSPLIPGARDRAGNDPIFIWNGEARRRAAAGEDIVNATIGALVDDGGTLCTLPTVIETMTRFQSEGRTGGYAPIAGLPAYREAVVRDVYGESPLADKAVAVATPGGSGAVYTAVVNFLGVGQKLLVPSYFWGPYNAITAHAGRGLETFEMFAADGTFDLEGMAAAIDRHLETQGRVLLVLNFPCHNPTGYSLGNEEWQEVAAIVRERSARGPVTVLVDAAYMEFAGPAARAWVDSVPGLLDGGAVLVAWTASKSMAQYGARLGALIATHGDDAEVEQIGNAFGYTARATWSNCPHVGQLAVVDLLTDPELAGRVRAERAEIASLLQERVDAFNRHAGAAGLRTPRYDAGFFVSVFSPDSDATAAAMRERGVYVIPIPGAVRVAICSTPAAAVPRLVDALAEGLAAVG